MKDINRQPQAPIGITGIEFTEENIARLFGHEAAEDESLDRLKQYYFKSKIFEKIRGDLSLRILVGHKGIGKSALFTMAIDEDRKQKILPILLRPDDILKVGTNTANFLQNIRDWKEGLLEIIAKKTLALVDFKAPKSTELPAKSPGKLLSFLAATLKRVFSKPSG